VLPPSDAVPWWIPPLTVLAAMWIEWKLTRLEWNLVLLLSERRERLSLDADSQPVRSFFQ
jgi:hypothetical protein